MKCGKSELERHALTAKHTRAMRAVNQTKDLQTLFQNNSSQDEAAKTGEIKLALFFAAKNVAFHIIDDLEPLLKQMFADSKICNNINVKRTKCTEIIKNVICKKETSDLVQILRTSYFSVLLYESTDISEKKT